MSSLCGKVFLHVSQEHLNVFRILPAPLWRVSHIVVGGSQIDVVSLPNPRPLAESLLRAYAQALQSRDIEAVKQVYPNLAADRERAWTDLFALGELTVSVSDVEIVAQETDRLTVRFRQTIEGRRLERNTTQFDAVLSQSQDGWRILSIR